MKEQKEQAEQKPKRKITADDIKNVAIAYDVIFSAIDVAFKGGAFQDMSDVATINKALEVSRNFLGYENFKNTKLNQLVNEFQTTNEDGDTVNDTRLVDAEFKPLTDAKGYGIEIADVKTAEEGINFMFVNGMPQVLKTGMQVIKINGTLIPVGEADIEDAVIEDTVVDAPLKKV